MNQYKRFSTDFEQIVGYKNIFIDEPMNKHTSFKVGGPADILLLPEAFEQVKKIITYCKENNIPYYIIGNGSNLLIRDGGIKGVVIKLSKLNNVQIKDNIIIADSGAALINVSHKALKANLSGLEFASGIPGSIGGAVAMNAGAYNGEISDIIEKAVIIDENGNIITFTKEQLNLKYRSSIIQQRQYIVLQATFRLHNSQYEDIKNRVMQLSKRRREHQPLEYPSAGSTFKRPEGHFAAKLIDDAGLKGTSVGGAQVSEKHSGFIINKKDATAKDILDLIEYVREKVKEQFNVDLDTEVRILGEEK